MQYLDHLASFKLRIKKPTKEDMKSRGDTARAETARLIDIFCQDEERESKIKQYQLELGNRVFKNDGKLRDYQAQIISVKRGQSLRMRWGLARQFRPPAT